MKSGLCHYKIITCRSLLVVGLFCLYYQPPCYVKGTAPVKLYILGNATLLAGVLLSSDISSKPKKYFELQGIAWITKTHQRKIFN